MKQKKMKWATAMLVVAAALGLGFGVGASASAGDSDPWCYSTCQELMNDCLAQVPEHQFKVCARQYRECIAGCDQQAR